jgi:glucose/arabinose dehydrogenase
MSVVRLGIAALFAIMFSVGGLLTAVAQDEEAAGYTAPVSSYEGATVAQPGGTLPTEVDLELVKVADGLFDAVNVASANDGRLFVVERFGRILIIDAEGTLLEEPFLDLSEYVITFGSEQGLLSLAFHPNYTENGLFYVNYSDARANGDQFSVEFSVSEDDPNVADEDSARALLSINEPYRNHNGGTIAFGPDGYLYIAVGDGGLAGDPYNNGQNINSVLGKLLRIDVDAQEGTAYGIPEDNPFTGPANHGLYNVGGDLEGGVMPSWIANPEAQTGAYRPGARPEIYHFGLRNPWQFSFDSETGDLYLTDVGQVAWEEINFIPAGSPSGLNFGWDFMEGGHCFPPESGVEAAQASSPAAPYGTLSGCSVVGVPPVAEYDHVTGCSITGIGVYRGTEFESLNGVYFAGDYCSGRFFGLARDDAGAWQFQEVAHTGLLVTGSGRGEDGRLYITSYDANFGEDENPAETPRGSLWMLVPADQVPEGAEVAPPPAEEEEEEAAPPVDDATPEASPSPTT